MGKLLPAPGIGAPRPALTIEPPAAADVLKPRHAFYALARNAAAVTESELVHIVPAAAPDAQAQLAEYAYTTDADCLLRADISLPPEHYPLLDALVGLSGGRTDWFPATDAQIAKRAARSQKWVQRRRDELAAWQQRGNFNLVDIADHYTDRDGKRHPHKYRLHLHRLAVETKRAAEADPKWADEHRRGFALQAAVRRTRDSIPEWSPRRARGRKQEPTAEEIIGRRVKTAATLLRKASKLLRGAELGRLAHGWQTSVPVDAERTTELFAAVAEFRALLDGHEPTENTTQGSAAALLDKMSTREFIGDERDQESDRPAVSFVQPDETYISLGATDEDIDRMYAERERFAVERV